MANAGKIDSVDSETEEEEKRNNHALNGDELKNNALESLIMCFSR